MKPSQPHCWQKEMNNNNQRISFPTSSFNISLQRAKKEVTEWRMDTKNVMPDPMRRHSCWIIWRLAASFQTVSASGAVGLNRAETFSFITAACRHDGVSDWSRHHLVDVQSLQREVAEEFVGFIYFFGWNYNQFVLMNFSKCSIFHRLGLAKLILDHISSEA